MWLSIGPLATTTIVTQPRPFPDDLLPSSDLLLEVVVSSAEIGLDGGDAPTAGATSSFVSHFRLPADGTDAMTADGRRFIPILLRAPDSDRLAEVRIAYFYGDVLVQSQLVAIPVGENPGVPEAITDFTITSDLQGLERLDRRSRLSILVNRHSDGDHRILVRRHGESQSSEADAEFFVVDAEAITSIVNQLREVLHDRAPSRLDRSGRELRDDLRVIAPLGALLYRAIDRRAWEFVADAERQGEDFVLAISTVDGETFTIPWSFVYDISLEPGTSPDEFEVCPAVEGDFPSERLRDCPHGHQAGRTTNVLCPWGLWGVRLQIEQHVSTDLPHTRISLSAGQRLLMARTSRNIDRGSLDTHLEEIADLATADQNGLQPIVVDSKDDLLRELGQDLPLVYFLCHGEDGERGKRLRLGRASFFEPGHLVNLIRDVYRRDGRRIWTNPTPLVFVNACESVVTAPSVSLDMVRAFMSEGAAAALIGTEVRVQQVVAQQFAVDVFRAVLTAPRTPLGLAFEEARWSLLRRRNLSGLSFTMWGHHDLELQGKGLETDSEDGAA